MQDVIMSKLIPENQVICNSKENNESLILYPKPQNVCEQDYLYSIKHYFSVAN